MNCVGEAMRCDGQIPGQTEIENSLHGFGEARERGLSTGERKMLHSAKQILISELVVATKLDYDGIEERLNAAL